MRKASYGSGNVRDAETRAILMSIYRTLKARGLDALNERCKALESLIKIGTLPPLPENPLHRAEGLRFMNNDTRRALDSTVLAARRATGTDPAKSRLISASARAFGE
jgi:hypothetical protein